MQEDFFDAHERHYDDAVKLYELKRWANADHLFGVAAECGLKALTVAFKGADLARGERFHVEEPKKPQSAWDVFETYRSGHAAGSNFVLPSSSPFSDWEVSQRYANRQNFNQGLVDPHREGASMIMGLLTTADAQGLL